jgi:TatD DNase family protein
MKLFDAHNHIHLGPRGLAPLLETLALEHSNLHTTSQVYPVAAFAGAAIMSTHSRDYPHVESVVSDLRQKNYKAVPCYGIHPWFLNDVLTDPESTRILENGDEVWLHDLKQRLIQQPDAIVGEIGLDGARWKELQENNTNDVDDENGAGNDNYKSIWERKRVLACPMHLQKDAFVKQLLLATELKRPVSIHVVRAWGELFDSLHEVREIAKQKIEQFQAMESEKTDNTLLYKHKKPTRIKEALLPPKMYFHAFSGKAGVVPSLLAACAKGNIDPNSDVYFGFAPAIPNFYAPKTPSIMRGIGLRRLLLETDLEDATCAWDDLIRCLEGIADALDVDVTEVADETYRNAQCFYFNNNF